MRNLFIILFIVLFLIVASAFCRSIAAPREPQPIPTIPVQSPAAPTVPLVFPTTTAPLATPVIIAPELPLVNSEWYIDGWAKDSVVVQMYGREMRFDQAEFRNIQTHAAIVVMCIDLQAASPNLDFTVPVEQRDRFVYSGNLFWHTTDPAVQRFVFVRHGELP